MGKRNSVKRCLLFIAVLYLDTLDVNDIQIPACLPRIGAWKRELINKVMKLDTNTDGGFGNLKLKNSADTIIEESILGRTEDIESFVLSKAKAGVSNQKKRKLCQLVNKVCVAITEVVGNFVGEVSELMDGDDHSAAEDGPRNRQSKRMKSNKSYEGDLLDDEANDDPNYEEEEDFEEDDEEEDEDEEEEEEQHQARRIIKILMIKERLKKMQVQMIKNGVMMRI